MIARSSGLPSIDFAAAAAAAGDLRSMVEADLGQPDRSGKHCCPFHEERSPSFHVYSDHYHCFGCGARGDALDWIARRGGFSLVEAARSVLGGVFSIQAQPRSTVKRAAPRREPAARPDGWREFVLQVVEKAQAALWSDCGTLARAYLAERGLSETTVKAARLSYWPADHFQRGLYDRPVFVPRGIVIPWLVGEAVEAVNIRRLKVNESEDKYHLLRGSRRGIYPGREVVIAGKPLALVEGEFDAILLNQELAGLCPAITLGSAKIRPSASILMAMLGASPWFVAGDLDRTGESSADDWLARSGRCRRIRPPAGKDWCDTFKADVNIRAWWIAATEERAPYASSAQNAEPEPDPTPAPEAVEVPLASPEPPPSWTPRPLPWRAAMDDWSLARREAWGFRTAALEDEGLTWDEAEERAVAELANVSEAELPPPAASEHIYKAPPARGEFWILRAGARPALCKSVRRVPPDGLFWCLEGDSTWHPIGINLPRWIKPKRPRKLAPGQGAILP
jgi:CHC2 zinc finger